MTRDTTICVDFDDTICDTKNREKGSMGKPLPGVEDALDELYGRGYSIVVYTLMARTESGKEAVAEWLDHYGIDYADVTAIKPDALVYIDNRAIRHTDWMSTMQQVNGITGYVDEY